MTTPWLEAEAQDLIREYAEIEPATVRRFLMEATAHLESRARVDTYVPVLARRMTRDRLRALARAEGLTEHDVPEVLFVCVHNAGRSQIAAVLLASMAGGRVRVRSAGSTPADEINPVVIEAMAELGLDLSQEFPKPLTDEAVRAADVVITMGCGDACPFFPGKRYLDWEISDPAGEGIESVRAIRDDIRTRVTGLLQELGHCPGRRQMTSLGRACAAEAIGTFLLVLFGTGAVAAAVLTGAQVGLWQVAVVWGFGVTLAIYATASVSGAHLNPAVTLAFSLRREEPFPRARILPYWGAQLAGAIAAGAVVLATFGPFIERFEDEHDIQRGEPGSEQSAMVFGEYFPNPAMFGTGAEAEALISPLHAAGIEALGTAVLVYMIFALTDPKNSARPQWMTPLFIGFTVAVLISLFAPATQAGWNPARDLGPRIVALLAGWGDTAIPGPRSGFWIYIVGPLLGGPLGGLLYDRTMR